MPNFSDTQDILEPVHPLPRDLLKVYVLGNTGAGKTTIIRKIMGTEKHAFPNIGNGRTTTVTTEYVLRKGLPFKATLVFKTQDEILSAIEDILFDAIDSVFQNKAQQNDDTLIENLVKNSLSETPDQTVRFKFILTSQQLEEIAQEILQFAKDKKHEDVLETEATSEFVKSKKEEIYLLIDSAVKTICTHELSEKYYSYERDDETIFIKESKKLLSNAQGSLASVLSYARVEGEFLNPQFKDYPLVLIDSEGIGHNLNAPPIRHFDFFHFSDYILFVEGMSDTTLFTSSEKQLKDIFEKGYANKLKVIFNKLNPLSIAGDKDAISVALRNLNGRVHGRQESNSVDIKEDMCFYLSTIDAKDAEDAEDAEAEIKKFLDHLQAESKKFFAISCNCDLIDFLSGNFLKPFLEKLNKQINEGHWKTVYAFNRRMVNSEDQYNDITPISDLCNAVFREFNFQQIIKFPEKITLGEQGKRINQVKQELFQRLLDYSRWTILTNQHAAWEAVLSISGQGSKNQRAVAISEIFSGVAQSINSSDFEERVKNSFNAICAADPRIKISAKNGIQLRIRGYKIIKDAEIKLTSLTIIAGENDTGKSTISKMLFKEVRKLILYRNSLAYPDLKLYPNYPVFIDTPDVLDKFSYIKNTQLLAKQNDLNYELPEWVTDLVLRLASKPSSPIPLDKHHELLQSIHEIIGGEIRYKQATVDDLVYEKESITGPIPILDTSTGIKMFGILQMLIQNQTIRPGSVLILDEPEVHIHPNWQLKYAELIIALVKNGVRVMLSSHSPYMIEALVRYSRREKVDNIELYLTEKENNQSNVQCVTHDISKIFDKLSEPFNEFNRLDLEEATHG